jgi:hypothetical protein
MEPAPDGMNGTPTGHQAFLPTGQKIVCHAGPERAK